MKLCKKKILKCLLFLSVALSHFLLFIHVSRVALAKSMIETAEISEPIKATVEPQIEELEKIEVEVEESTPTPTNEPTTMSTETPSATRKAALKPTAKPTTKPTPEPIEESSTHNLDDYKNAARYIAKTIYGEARGCSKTERAAVVWCILNRVDKHYSGKPKDIIRVITAKHQFTGYKKSNPVKKEHYNLALDVIERWLREKNGEANVGRVLPREYLYFSGKNGKNIFRTKYKGGKTWKWGLKSPY